MCLKSAVIIVTCICTCTCVQLRLQLSNKEVVQRHLNLPFVTGDSLTDLNITSLAFIARAAHERRSSLKSISDFPDLKTINMLNFSLKTLPYFVNLPKLSMMHASKNHITRISSYALSNVTVHTVTLSSNRISSIEDGSFGNSITWLFLSCNRLRELSPRWFRNPGTLEVLELQNNKIQYLQDGLLRVFNKLKELDLSYNEMLAIGDGALSGSNRMEFLSLAVNNLTELPVTVFAGGGIQYIEYLDLVYNQLNFLSQQFLAKVAVEHLGLHGNPWHCVCLRNIEVWMSHRDVQILHHARNATKNDPVCIFPLVSTGMCVEHNDAELYDTYIPHVTSARQPSCKTR